MHKVKQAQYLDGYRMLLSFEDHSIKIVDFQIGLDNFEGPIFRPLKDLSFFKSFKLNLNTVAWENGADVSPDYLYEIGIQE